MPFVCQVLDPQTRLATSPTMRFAMWVGRVVIFVGLNVWIVSAYCRAMVGKLEPLEFRPEEFVIRPLMVFTAVVSVLLYPLLLHQRTRLNRGLLLYLGFVLISALYGLHLWNQFPDGSAWAVPLAVVGGHLYGAPVFLMVLLANLLLGRMLFPMPNDEVK